MDNTLAIVEVKESFGWMDPMADVTLDDLVQKSRVGSYHLKGMNGGFLDGQVRFIDLTVVSSETLQSMAASGNGRTTGTQQQLQGRQIQELLQRSERMRQELPLRHEQMRQELEQRRLEMQQRMPGRD
ncbi:MAG: hypothetical protein FWC43_10835 [Planctomycetaceae bacterium]|nr:hypothetical protein [Planctomycetaceae bacterium]